MGIPAIPIPLSRILSRFRTRLSAKFVSIEPVDADWSSMVGGVSAVIEVCIRNSGEAGKITIVPTDLPASWMLDSYSLSHQFETKEEHTFQFVLTPPTEGGHRRDYVECNI